MTCHYASCTSSEVSDDSVNRCLRLLLDEDSDIGDSYQLTDSVIYDEKLYSRSRRQDERLQRSLINENPIDKQNSLIRFRNLFQGLVLETADSSSEAHRYCRKMKLRAFNNSGNAKLIRNEYSSWSQQRRTSRLRENDEDLHVNLPTIRIVHTAIVVNQACQVSMVYIKEQVSSLDSDQIVIRQQQTDRHRRILVYKGFLKKNEKFSFKSQRSIQSAFDIKFYINGQFKFHLLTCCEYKYSRKMHILCGSFVIEHVEKSIPCRKCRRRRQEQTNDDQNIQSSLLTRKICETNQSREMVRRKESTEKTFNDDNRSTQLNSPNLQSIKLLGHGLSHQQNLVGGHIVTPSSVFADERDDLRSQRGPIQKNDENKEFNGNEDRQDSQHRLISTDNAENEESNENHSLHLTKDVYTSDRHDKISERCQGNVENFILILFGLAEKVDFNRSIINLVRTFSHAEELKSFINEILLEKLILITSDSGLRAVGSLSKFYSVYILSTGRIQQSNCENIRGVFPTIELISQQIRAECSLESDFFSVEFCSIDDNARRMFSYLQLLKETLLKKDIETNLNKDFIDFCRFHYDQNQIVLNLIHQFEQDFTSDKSICWFLEFNFVRKILNRALRTHELDLLYKTRFILQCFSSKVRRESRFLTVYRVHHFLVETLEDFRVNELISFNTFVHCQLNRPVLVENIRGMETVVFQIQTEFGVHTEDDRYSNSTVGYVLPFDNVYSVESVKQQDEHYWIISLISIDKDNDEFRRATKDLREDIRSPVALIQLGKLLLSNNKYAQVDCLARCLFNDGSLKDNPTLLAALAALHHLLGSTDNRNNNYRVARHQFEKSLKIFLTFVSEDNQILSATYNNIGSMFYQEDQHEQAVVYHQKALQCQLKSSSPDIEAIATYSGNIGAVYLDQAKYEQALQHYKRSLAILEQLGPSRESLSVAMIYDRIASVYWRMDKPSEALPFYRKALNLELKYLPENDHKISVSYFNLSTAYAKLNQLEDAIDCAEKSLKQLLKSVQADHPEVKENTEQLEGLRRKKWLQRLYE